MDTAMKPVQNYSYRLDQGVLANKTQDNFTENNFKKTEDRRANSRSSIVNTTKRM